MIAVFKTGGKQYKVTVGSILKIEKLEGDSGSEVVFDEVLLIHKDSGAVIIGSPFIKGATVKADIINQTRDEKIIVFKKKRRKNYRRKAGHRQHITFVKIKEVSN